MNKVDAAFEAGLKRDYEKSEITRIRDYCLMVDEMSRSGLLTAHGWDSTKANTARVRRLAKERIRANDPHFDIWCGYAQQHGRPE
jgi:hypothetical protein